MRSNAKQRNKYAALDITAHLESTRRHRKSNYSTVYPNMIELHDGISMNVRHRWYVKG